MPSALTALIPCKDELIHIRDCIDSLRGVADEILVADSGSTDGTLEAVLADPTCRVIQREYRNSADFKNWAIVQAKHEWIILLDADERLTPECAAEILALKQKTLDETDLVAYDIRRANYVFGQPIKYSGWQHDSVKRLFRRSCRYETRRVHADLDVPKEQVGRLKHPLLHFSVRTLKHFIDKTYRYAKWGAEELVDRRHRCTYFDLFVRPVWRFLRHYIFQGGILDGLPGLVISGLMGYGVFLKYSSLWEMTLPNHQATRTPRTKNSTPSAVSADQAEVTRSRKAA